MSKYPMVTLGFERTRPRRHLQVAARGVKVDKQIAPLLETLWDRGFDTQWSCQGYPMQYALLPTSGYAYIVFHEQKRAFEFLIETAPRLVEVQDMMAMKLHLMTDGRAAVEFSPAVLAEITEIWSA